MPDFEPKMRLQDIPPVAQEFAIHIAALGTRRGIVAQGSSILSPQDIPLYIQLSEHQEEIACSTIELSIFEEARTIQESIDQQGLTASAYSSIHLLIFKAMFAQAYALDYKLPKLNNIDLTIARFDKSQPMHPRSRNKIAIVCRNPEDPTKAYTFTSTLYHLAKDYEHLTGIKIDSKKMYALLKKGYLQNMTDPDKEETEEGYHYRLAQEIKSLDAFTIHEAEDDQKEALYKAKYYMVHMLLTARTILREEQNIFLYLDLGGRYERPYQAHDTYEIRVVNPRNRNEYISCHFPSPFSQNNYTTPQAKHIQRLIEKAPLDGTYWRGN